MRIAVLADIHGHVEYLQRALARLRAEGVGRIVLLGDVIVNTRNAAETVEMLQAHGAVGVWGNHELGLCVDPDETLQAAYGSTVVDFFRTLQPRFEINDLLFSHSLPSEDPTDPTSYYLNPRPEEEGALAASFTQYPHRAIFIGHFHRWFAATDNQPLDWKGERPLLLAESERYFIGVNAVMSGYMAIFDQEKQLLLPVKLDGN